MAAATTSSPKAVRLPTVAGARPLETRPATQAAISAWVTSASRDGPQRGTMRARSSDR